MSHPQFRFTLFPTGWIQLTAIWRVRNGLDNGQIFELMLHLTFNAAINNAKHILNRFKPDKRLLVHLKYFRSIFFGFFHHCRQFYQLFRGHPLLDFWEQIEIVFQIVCRFTRHLGDFGAFVGTRYLSFVGIALLKKSINL